MNLTYPNSSGGGENTSRQAENYFEQLEHGGGLCTFARIFLILKLEGKSKLHKNMTRSEKTVHLLKFFKT